MGSIKRILGVGSIACGLAGGPLLYPMLAERGAERPVAEVLGDRPVEGRGSVGELRATYARWAKAYRATNPPGPVASLLWNRGLSSEYSDAKGIAQVDLARKKISVRVKGLTDPDISDVWLVVNRLGDGRSVLPEDGDRLVNAGALQFGGDSAWLDAELEELADLALDIVVVARRGEHPGRKGVLVGTMSLFQKMYHYPEQQRPRHNSLTDAVPTPEPGGLGDLLIRDAHAGAGLTPSGFYSDLDTDLVNEGRDIFFNETFDGNGRTCGTCHREEDNMALGLKTIAELNDDDPLFIVEQQYLPDGEPNPLYKEYRFERPALMRQVGLIFENLNGFREADGSFTTRGAMRAPQHVLSVRTTLAPPPVFADDGTLPVNADDLVFAERTGWSGDGTPTGFLEDFFESNGRELTGALRDFAVGAIIQHFSRTLERSAFATDEDGNPREPDFRLPTEEELDALEAFMLSVGRQVENDDLDSIQLTDWIAERGRLNYMGFNVFDADPDDGRPPLNCNACHLHGGANTDPTFPFPPSVTPNHDLADLAANGGMIPSHNRSFGPGVERLADQAGDIIAQVDGDPSVAGDCYEQGLGVVPLKPGDMPGVPSTGCGANPIDNGFAFGVGDTLAGQRIVSDRFNAPPVFEAMDNPPFFHGHQINTIEGAVAFYATNRHFRNGDFAGAIVPLNAAQVTNVARFMRVMGADFNAEQAIIVLRKAVDFASSRKSARTTNVRLAIADIEDAIELLEPAQLHFDDAIPLFEDAIELLETPYGVTAKRKRLLNAIVMLGEAQRAMVIREGE